MKTTETTPTSSGASPQQTAAGVSRRQIVRAGLSAAPVVAVLKSNTVLAGGTGNAVAPSGFESLRANQGSVSPNSAKSAIQVRTPSDWVSKTSDLKKKKFLSSGFVGAPVIKNKDENKRKDEDGDKGKDKDKNKVTLGDVLTYDGTSPDAVLARYVVASYLTALEFHNDRGVLALTTLQCNEIWNQKGVWTPFAGARWDYAKTITYFEAIYGIRG